LHAQGVAPDDWIASFLSRAAMIPGIRDVDASHLISATEAEFQRLEGVVDSTVLTFPVGSADLVPDQAASLKALAPEIAAFLQKAQMLHKSVVLEVVGHSDSTGPESTNQLLSKERADNVAWQLEREGAARSALQPTGVAASKPLRPETDEQARQYNRSVTFGVSAAESPKP